jgi:hypothetical protein
MTGPTARDELREALKLARRAIVQQDSGDIWIEADVLPRIDAALAAARPGELDAATLGEAAEFANREALILGGAWTTTGYGERIAAEYRRLREALDPPPRPAAPPPVLPPPDPALVGTEYRKPRSPAAEPSREEEKR